MQVQKRLVVLWVMSLCVALLLGTLIFPETPIARARGIAAPNASVPKVDPKVNAKYVGGIQAAKSPVAKKLLPLDATAKYPDAVIPDSIQRRVTGTCPANSAVSAVKTDGTVNCQNVSGIIGPEGPAGPQGPSGQATFYTRNGTASVSPGQKSIGAFCDSGDQPVGGGGGPSDGSYYGSGLVLTESVPTASGWQLTVNNSTGGSISIKTQVICADTTP